MTNNYLYKHCFCFARNLKTQLGMISELGAIYIQIRLMAEYFNFHWFLRCWAFERIQVSEMKTAVVYKLQFNFLLFKWVIICVRWEKKYLNILIFVRKYYNFYFNHFRLECFWFNQCTLCLLLCACLPFYFSYIRPTVGIN